MDSGHTLDHISVVGQDYAVEELPIGYVNTGDRIWSWGKFGAFWGSVWGLLLGSAMMFIPGIGYVMFAGWLVSALEGALVGGGVGAVAGALASIGIPEHSVLKYHAFLKDGGFMVIIHGDEAEAAEAKKLLEATPTTSLETYTAPKAGESE